MTACVATSTLPESTYGTPGPSQAEHKVIANNRLDATKDAAAVQKDAREQAKKVCPSGYVIKSQRFLPDQYFSKDQAEPSIVLEARVQCTAEPRGDVEGVGAVVVEDLASFHSDTVFFDTHAVTLAAPLDRSFKAALTVLQRRGDLIWKANERKGTIVTAATKHGVVGRPFYDQFFIAFDHVSANETKMTLKLFSHWRDYDAGDPPLMKPHTREAVYQRASAFAEAVQAAAAKR